MAWSFYQKILALMMVVTGSINTLATKWADESESVGKDGGPPRKFNHPFLQASCMFLGELLCLLLFKILYAIYKRREQNDGTPLPNIVDGSQNFNPFIFLAPALCDMTATSLMYIGLNLTYASSFQMLRGAVIVFTGLLSVAFLNRHLKTYEWLGIFIVILGLACVGASDLVYPSDTKNFDRNSILTGDELIILAQIITAAQMVIEETFVGKKNVPPLQGVGWEGFFGFITLSLLLIPMYFIPVGHTLFQNPGGNLEDAIDGFYQIANSWKVALAITGTILSIAFFNFAGLSVTKEMSATTRMVLDSIRTFVIWIVTLLTREQKFNWLQLLGFFVLSIGMCLYNDVVIRPLYMRIRWGKHTDAEKEALISNDPEIHPKSGSINA